MKLDLGNILGRAWKITWNYKVLWFFGVLAALSNGGGGGNGGGSSSSRSSSSGNGAQIPPEIGRYLQDLERLTPSLMTIIGGIICVLLLLGLAILFLSLIGRGGLISGVRLAEANGHLTFGEAWEQGMANLGKLFLIKLPALALGLVILLIILIPTLLFLPKLIDNDTSALIGFLPFLFGCALPVICVGAIVGILLNILIHFANFAAVLEDHAFLEAYRRAWEILKTNIVDILVLGVIFVVSGGIIQFIAALPLAIAVVPIVLSGAFSAATQSGNFIFPGIILALVCCAAYLPILLLIQGVFETWTTSAWTLAYLQFSGKAPTAPAPVLSYPVPLSQ